MVSVCCGRMRRLAFGRPTACVLIHTIAEGGKCYATNYLTTFNTGKAPRHTNTAPHAVA